MNRDSAVEMGRAMESELGLTIFSTTKRLAAVKELMPQLHSKLLDPEFQGTRDPRSYLLALARGLGEGWRKREDKALAAFAQSPAGMARAKELRKLVSHMPLRQREVLLLTERKGYSCEEAARRLEISAETVKKLLSGALQRIASYEFDSERAPSPKRVDGTLFYDVTRAVEVSAVELPRLALPRIEIANVGLAVALQRYPDALYGLSSRQFETLVAEILVDKGFDVHLTPATRDGGFDIFAYQRTDIGTLLYLVETKRYRADRKVGIDLVRNLYGTFASCGASHAILATTSTFTRDARELQCKHPYQLSLRDYTDIVKWIREFGRSGKSV